MLKKKLLSFAAVVGTVGVIAASTTAASASSSTDKPEATDVNDCWVSVSVIDRLDDQSSSLGANTPENALKTKKQKLDKKKQEKMSDKDKKLTDMLSESLSSPKKVTAAKSANVDVPSDIVLFTTSDASGIPKSLTTVGQTTDGTWEVVKQDIALPSGTDCSVNQLW